MEGKTSLNIHNIFFSGSFFLSSFGTSLISLYENVSYKVKAHMINLSIIRFEESLVVYSNRRKSVYRTRLVEMTVYYACNGI